MMEDRIFEKYLKGEDEALLNFHDINNNINDIILGSLSCIEDYIEKGCFWIKNIRTFLLKDFPKSIIFEFLTEDILENRLNATYFKDIETNKELIKVINHKIHHEIKELNFSKDFELQSKYIDSENLKYEYLEDSEYLHELWKRILSYEAISFLYLLKKYFVPDLEIEFENNFNLYKPLFEDTKIDKRKTAKPITNNEKLKALTEFCPELIKRLHKLKVKEQKIVLNLITGVNKDDAYKKVITTHKRVIINTTFKNDEIDIEDLKNKLNIT
jgi:hypothetical protein